MSKDTYADPSTAMDTGEAEIHGLGAMFDRIYDAAATIRRLTAERDALRFALQGLHDDNADYLRLNNLGGYDNHWMVAARLALSHPKVI